jgi:hypothetical protein
VAGGGESWMADKFLREVVSHGHTNNCQRSYDLVDLLEKTISKLKEMQEEYKRSDGMQPYLIDDVVVDLYNGMVAVYYNLNE